MFKLTGVGGRRNSNPGAGVAQASRRIVSPNNRFQSGPFPHPHRVAFLPDFAQEQTWDSNSPRLGGLESPMPQAGRK